MAQKETKARIRAQGWFLTYPQCGMAPEDCMEALKLTGKVKEAVVAQEEHKDGSLHLHAFVRYEAKVEWKSDRWDIGSFHGNYQKAKSWDAVKKYVKKGGNYVSFGFDPFAALAKKAARNGDLLKMSAKQAVDEGLIDLLQLPNLIKAKNAYMLQDRPQDQEACRGIWLYGKPGVGKSYRVRTSEPSLFVKAQNKWWDGYLGEEAVLIDDFDQQGKCLGHYLKIWADRWSCTGEVKGGTIPLNFKRLYITSNYTIEELFPDDLEMQAAIRRRFKIEHIIGWNSDKSLFE